MRGNFGFEFKVGIGSPAGEVGHEGSGLVVRTYHERARRTFGKRASVRLAYRNGGYVIGFTDGHAYVAFDVVVNYTSDGAGIFGLQRLVFECVVAAADKSYLALDVDVGIVDPEAYAGNGDIFESVGRVVVHVPTHQGVQIFKEVVFLCRGGAGLGVEHDVAAVGDKISALCSADGGNGQSRVISGGRTYRSRIGVGGHVGVALFAALSRAVIVAGRDNKAYARLVDFVVNIVDVAAVFFTGKTARRAQRHVYGVHAQYNGVFHRRNDVLRFAALLKIGEHFHEYQLSIHSHAHDTLFVRGLGPFGRAAADDAAYVRAVVGIIGEYVVIFIGVIVSIRYFFAVIDVVYLQALGGLCGIGVAENRRNGFSRHGQLVVGHVGLGGKYRMRAVKARIQYCHRRSLSRIGHAAGIENTRLVNIHDIYHARSVGASRRFLRTVVGIGQICRRCAADFVHVFEIAVCGFDGYGVCKCVIAVQNLFYHAFIRQFVYKRVLICGKLGSLSLAFGRGDIIGYRRIFAAGKVGIYERVSGQFDYCDNDVVVFIAVVLEKIFGFYLRRNVFLRQF